MEQILLRFLFICLSSLAFAQIPGLGSCPTVQPQPSFILEKFLGLWWEQLKYPFAIEFGSKCIQTNYTRLDDELVSVNYKQLGIFTGRVSSIEGIGKMESNGILKISFQMYTNGTIPYVILGTDYDNFAVIYNCMQYYNIFHSKFLWIMTRTRDEISPNDLEQIYKILINNNLPNGFLSKTDLLGCDY